MKRESKAPTLSDVANRAGVSLYTASVVLNGARSNTRVSEATRKRILETAEQLRYHPNAMARALVHRRMQTIGVLCGFVGASAEYITNPYISAVLQGALVAAARADCCVTLFTQTWLDAPRSAPRFRDGRTDGILVIPPPTDSDVVAGLAALKLPLSVVAYPGEPYGVPCVDVDNAKGIRIAVEHLLSLGHHRIAHLAGSRNMASAPIRQATFCAALAEAGIPVPADYIQPCGYGGDYVEEAMQRLLALPKPPTAVVAGNDVIAITALKVAQNLDVSVPEHLSIIGFDDAPAASLLTPTLTTIRQPLMQIGEAATRLLLMQIEGETVPFMTHLLEPELIVRGSTAPAVSSG